jgi:hypothetical protein
VLYQPLWWQFSNMFKPPSGCIPKVSLTPCIHGRDHEAARFRLIPTLLECGWTIGPLATLWLKWWPSLFRLVQESWVSTVCWDATDCDTSYVWILSWLTVRTSCLISIFDKCIYIYIIYITINNHQMGNPIG